MKISYKDQPHKKINYYPIQNNMADVFLHKNETFEIDEEGKKTYKAEEVYFNVKREITKENIELNFESFWENEGIAKVNYPDTAERVDELENIVLMLLEEGNNA